MPELYLWEQLAVFARLGTLSLAARELHVSQPALSRGMKKLEEELGVALFLRDTAKIALNETGKIAAEHARMIVDQNRVAVERITAFDRSLRGIVLGSCAPWPVAVLLPLLRAHFPGMAVSAEIPEDGRLLEGLRGRRYQLAVLNEAVADGDVFCLRHADERLFLSVPETHRLAGRASVRFADLDGERILLHARIGQWLPQVGRCLPRANQLIQTELDALNEMIHATSFPFFNSDRMIALGYVVPGRVNLPIDEAAARMTYHVACLAAERERFAPFLGAVGAAAGRED